MAIAIVEPETAAPPETTRGPRETDPKSVPTAVTAECCCPDFCERDHDNE